MEVTQLKRVPLFADVPDEKLQKIAPWVKVDEFAEGKVVMKEGGYANDFFVIEEGTAKVEREGQHLADLGPGDVVGEQGLLERQQRSATVTATSTLRVLKIEHWELSRMRKAIPEVVEELYKKAEERSKG